MSATFEVSLVTPERQVLDDEVTYASVPAWDGQVGLMPQRAAMLAKLGDGILRLDYPEGGSRWYFLQGGFAQMQDRRLTLLTDQAIPAEKVVRSSAEAELVEAQALVAITDDEVSNKQRAVARAKSLIQLSVHQKDGI